MSIRKLTVKIKTPTGMVPPGRGFYQCEEDTLYVQTGLFRPERRFFSYLESRHVRFDIDRFGRLMMIEVNYPRRRWSVCNEINLPPIIETADVRWLDFRADMAEPEIFTNRNRDLLWLCFDRSHSRSWVQIAESVLLQIDRHSHVTGVLINDIVDDLAGRELAAYRRHLDRIARHDDAPDTARSAVYC